MGLFDRLFGPREDEHAPARPLWQAVVAEARRPRWYAELGVADSVPGRFDAVALVLALVLQRMERDPALGRNAQLLTELFIRDMDGQLRETGLGDMVVGKHVGKLMGALGGRKAAITAALTGSEPLEDALGRNMTLIDGADLPALAAETRALAARLAATDNADLFAGRFAA